jgi:dolichol-phosphate mannosyltransferase
LRLSRNFGSHLAIQAALDAAQADAVCTLAADLQDPVETVLGFVDKWRAGAKIVWGKRRARSDEGWRVIASNLFSSLIRCHAMPRGSKFTTGSFLLMDREVMEAVRRFPEQNRITFAIVAWTGFPQEVVEYDRAPRLAGKSGWSLGRMFKTMYDAFLGFSPLPAQIITGLGLFTFALCLLFSLYVIANWLQGSPIPGWTSIMVMLSFFFGLQFVILGLMGEYLTRIHCEVLRRPLYFVSQKAPEDAPPG